jgi:iron(III) transport system permease protein
MTRWRFVVIFVLVLLVAPPIVLAGASLLSADGISAFRDVARLSTLAITSVSLASLTALLALPLGTAIAVFLFKSDLPERFFLRRIVVLGLFVPLPIFATAWQSVLGDGMAIFTAAPGRPWPDGLVAAAIIHAIAITPWVVWIVGQGLTWVEPEIEDDALLSASPWTVLVRVTLPRALPAIAAAAIWIVVQTTTEITVTDMTLVRTYAEEVYTQMVLPDDPNAAGAADRAMFRAAAIAVPPMLITAIVLVMGLLALDRRSPALQSASRDRPLIQFGAASWLLALGMAALIGAAVVVPVASLIQRVGVTGTPPTWSLEGALAVFRNTVRAHGGVVLSSLAVAIAVGLAAAMVGLIAAWISRDSVGARLVVIVLAALALAAPAPVIGIGIKQAILWLVELESRWRGHVFSPALYSGESLLPVFWADLVRLWPFALILIWPTVRAIPRDFTDAVRTDGASPIQELRLLIAPLSKSAFARAVVAVGALCLGELGASKITATVGGQTLAHDVFTQMHYGVSPTLAAQCLLLLMLILPVVCWPWNRTDY